MKLPVYLDNNATTKMDSAVLDEMMPYFIENYGNAASRSHVLGLIAKDAVELSRQRVANLIGVHPEEIVFTSGATESDNLAIKGVFEAYKSRGNHIITVSTEHKAVLDTCLHIEKLGGNVTYLKVDKNGFIDLQDLENSVNSSTVLISVMFGNNETGTIQNIKEIGRIAKKKNILFFTDATQAVGKVDLNVEENNINLMSFSSHKIYGPNGVGALYVKRKNPRVKITAQMDGGGHERNMRSGTLNVAGIVGFGKACEICSENFKVENERISLLRDKLEDGLLSIEETYLNSDINRCLPNVTNISFAHLGSTLLNEFSKVIAVSSGSACTSASLVPSYVLKAQGLSDELAKNSIRFSLGRFTTEEEIDFTIKTVKESVDNLRKNSISWEVFKFGKSL